MNLRESRGREEATSDEYSAITASRLDRCSQAHFESADPPDRTILVRTFCHRPACWATQRQALRDADHCEASPWAENIIRPRGFTPTDAGTLGAVMLVGGLFGAVIIPPFSDRQHRRKKFLLLGITLSIPGLIGLTFATTYELLMLSAFSLGFFLISTSPIGMQYAAEITFPTPEGTSNGLIQLFGQASVVFVYIMEALKRGDGSFTPSLLLAVGLLLVSAAIITQLHDPEPASKPIGAVQEISG